MEKSNQVQQESNLSIYERVRCVPNEAKKEIEAGRLKGKRDINPMWRIKALTEVFGPAGFGWYTEIVRTWTEASESGEMAVFVDINLYVKKDRSGRSDTVKRGHGAWTSHLESARAE